MAERQRRHKWATASDRPAMTERPEGNARVGPEQWEDATARIAAMWEHAGFRRHPGTDIHLLDPAGPEQPGILAALREELAELIAAYKSAQRPS